MRVAKPTLPRRSDLLARRSIGPPQGSRQTAFKLTSRTVLAALPGAVRKAFERTGSVRFRVFRYRSVVPSWDGNKPSHAQRGQTSGSWHAVTSQRAPRVDIPGPPISLAGGVATGALDRPTGASEGDQTLREFSSNWRLSSHRSFPDRNSPVPRRPVSRRLAPAW